MTEAGGGCRRAQICFCVSGKSCSFPLDGLGALSLPKRLFLLIFLPLGEPLTKEKDKDERERSRGLLRS